MTSAISRGTNNPSVIYNSNTLNIPVPVAKNGYRFYPQVEQSRNVAGDGTTEFVNKWVKFVVEITFLHFDWDHRRDIESFLSYINQGNTFSFAYDRDRVVNTTLDGAAAAAQKVIPLTATTGVTAQHVYKIKNSTSDYEFVEVDSVSAGVSATAEDNLINTYASGDPFIYIDYWPELILLEQAYPEYLGYPKLFNLTLRAIEKDDS